MGARALLQACTNPQHGKFNILRSWKRLWSKSATTSSCCVQKRTWSRENLYCFLVEIGLFEWFEDVLFIFGLNRYRRMVQLTVDTLDYGGCQNQSHVLRGRLANLRCTSGKKSESPASPKMMLNFSSAPKSSKSIDTIRSNAVSTVHIFNRKLFGKSSCFFLRKGRQQELQARLMEADRNRDELQRVREELQMYLQCQVEKGELDQTCYICCSWNRQGVLWPGTLSSLGTLSLIDDTQKLGPTRKPLTSTLSYVHMPTLGKTAIYGNNPGHTD